MLVLDGFTATVSLAFTPDCKRLIVGQAAGPLDAWTLAGGERVQLLPRSTGANPILAVHPSGHCLFVINTQILTLVSLDDQSAVPSRRAGNVIISPGGEWVIVRSAADLPRALFGFRCEPDGSLAKVRSWEAVPQVDDESLCGFLAAGEQFVTREGRVLLVHDTATGAVQFTVPYPSNYLLRSAIAPDGGRLAVMGYDKLYIWDTARWGKPTRIACPGGRRFTSLAFHPTRPILAAIQSGQTLVKFLDANTGKLITKFQWKLGEMCEVAFSPDGTLAAAGSLDGKIVVWDVDE